jgi:hypothetical protein
MRVVLFLDHRPKKYDFIHSDLSKSPFTIVTIVPHHRRARHDDALRRGNTVYPSIQLAVRLLGDMQAARDIFTLDGSFHVNEKENAPKKLHLDIPKAVG